VPLAQGLQRQSLVNVSASSALLLPGKESQTSSLAVTWMKLLSNQWALEMPIWKLQHQDEEEVESVWFSLQIVGATYFR